MSDVVNVFTNFGIALSYLFVAVAVLPYSELKRAWIRWSGVGFFITCGFTHTAMGLGSLMGDHHLLFESGFMLVNHVLQLVATWIFVVGLYIEFVVDPRREA